MVILNFLAAPRAARTGRARDLGEQENWGEAFQKTDTYANLALVVPKTWNPDVAGPEFNEIDGKGRSFPEAETAPPLRFSNGKPGSIIGSLTPPLGVGFSRLIISLGTNSVNCYNLHILRLYLFAHARKTHGATLSARIVAISMCEEVHSVKSK